MSEFHLMAAQVSEYHDALRKQGADAERERIIKLLEDWIANVDIHEEPLEAAIALIRGEYK